MHYKFVDIGTAFFDTSVELYPDEPGILVEPVKKYLDLVPTSSNVIKANYAISDYDGDGSLTISKTDFDRYYTKQELIDIFYNKDSSSNELFWKLAFSGCSKLNEKHSIFLEHKNIELEVVNTKVVSFHSFCDLYDITSIEYFNIDTEGHETVILPQVLERILEKKLVANKIKFEYNMFSDKALLDKIIDKYVNSGLYSCIDSKHLWNEDKILVLRTPFLPGYGRGVSRSMRPTLLAK